MFKLKTTIFLVSIFCFVAVNNLEAASAVCWCNGARVYGVCHRAGTEAEAKKIAEADFIAKVGGIEIADKDFKGRYIVKSTEYRHYCAIAYILNKNGVIENIGCSLGCPGEVNAANIAKENCTRNLEEREQIKMETWYDETAWEHIFGK